MSFLKVQLDGEAVEIHLYGGKACRLGKQLAARPVFPLEKEVSWLNFRMLTLASKT